MIHNMMVLFTSTKLFTTLATGGITSIWRYQRVQSTSLHAKEMPLLSPDIHMPIITLAWDSVLLSFSLLVSVSSQQSLESETELISVCTSVLRNEIQKRCSDFLNLIWVGVELNVRYIQSNEWSNESRSKGYGIYATFSLQWVPSLPTILKGIFPNISFYAKNKYILLNFLLCKTRLWTP